MDSTDGDLTLETMSNREYHTAEPAYIFESPTTEIYVGDCRTLMPVTVANDYIDLVFADPPFNYEVDYGPCKDDLKNDLYLLFTVQWIDQCIRVLKPGGSLWVNVPDEWAAEIVVNCKTKGLDLVNWCIWHYRFGQCRSTSFISSKTHVLYFAKGRKQRKWRPERILVPSDRSSIYDDPRTQQSRTPGMRVPLDVWYGPNLGRIQGNNAERRPEHPNQIPELYMARVIQACSDPGDVVLDPFLGSGTTTTVARALGRRSIGFELNPEFAASAADRTFAGPVRKIALNSLQEAIEETEERKFTLA